MPEVIVPILHAMNAHKTAEWYARLGFKVEGEHQFAPGMPYYLFLGRDRIHLHQSEQKGDTKVGTLMYFYVHDVDSITSEFGVEVIDQPWCREVQLTDPDENRLRIGERKAQHVGDPRFAGTNILRFRLGGKGCRCA